MSLSNSDIELIAQNILNKEEIDDIKIVIDEKYSKAITYFIKSDKTIHINKKALGMSALTFGTSEEAILTIRMFLESAHRNNCNVPNYRRYEELLALKGAGTITTEELMEYNKIFNDLEVLAWDYCENRVKAEFNNYLDTCRILRTSSLN